MNFSEPTPHFRQRAIGSGQNCVYVLEQWWVVSPTMPITSYANALEWAGEWRPVTHFYPQEKQ